MVVCFCCYYPSLFLSSARPARAAAVALLSRSLSPTLVLSRVLSLLYVPSCALVCVCLHARRHARACALAHGDAHGQARVHSCMRRQAATDIGRACIPWVDDRLRRLRRDPRIAIGSGPPPGNPDKTTEAMARDRLNLPLRGRRGEGVRVSGLCPFSLFSLVGFPPARLSGRPGWRYLHRFLHFGPDGVEGRDGRAHRIESCCFLQCTESRGL